MPISQVRKHETASGFSLAVRVSVCAMCVLGTSPRLDSQGQALRLSDVQISPRSVTSFSKSQGGDIYEVNFAFRVGAQPVELAGFGTLTGSGELTFLLAEPKLLFLNPATGTSLGEVQLRKTGTLAGAEDVKDLPGASDFSPGRLFDCVCSSEQILFQRVNAALNRFFVSGYQPETFTKPYRLVSTYRRLPLPRPYVGKLAVRIEYPTQTEDGRLGFRIASSARESATSSSTWVSAREQIVTNAAAELLDQIVKAVRNP